ncbi:MAG TPA: hypothetical protein VEU78_08530 [Steroidobacteraceae bacterium]|nr:hypothetical protein [Steroidobacteraceae bacterium]
MPAARKHNHATRFVADESRPPQALHSRPAARAQGYRFDETGELYERCLEMLGRAARQELAGTFPGMVELFLAGELLTALPLGLRRRLRIVAAQRGVTMTSLVLETLHAVVESEGRAAVRL